MGARMTGSSRVTAPIDMPIEYAILLFAYRLGRMLPAFILQRNIND
jgi:hypothetical protein